MKVIYHSFASMKKKKKYFFKLNHTKLLTHDKKALKCSKLYISTKYRLQNIIQKKVFKLFSQ